MGFLAWLVGGLIAGWLTCKVISPRFVDAQNV